MSLPSVRIERPSQLPDVSRPPNASQASASGSPATSDACVLLAPADLATIFDGNVDVGRPMPSAGWVAAQCAWNLPTSGFMISVGTATSIQKFGDPTAPDAKARLAAFKQEAKAAGGNPKDVDGIGDGAVVASTGMAAYKGDIYLQVLSLGMTKKELVQVVKLVVARL